LKYYYIFQKLREEFDEVQVEHIHRDINNKADELARLGTSLRLGKLKTFILHTLPVPSVSAKECLQVEGEKPESKKNKIVEYLLKGTLLEDKEKAKKLRTQAAR